MSASAKARTRAGGYLTVVVGVVVALVAGTAAAEENGLPFGRAALPEEIAAWDIDIRPDGIGLPSGSASAADGETLYYERCAACHGEFGEGVDRWPVLMGGFDTLTDDRPEKTVGSYWPYTSTLWDYIHRAMPFGEAQSLTDDEVYAVSLYVLYMNDIVALDEVYDQDGFAAIAMPNKDGFFMPDPRPDTPMGEPCMQDCDAPVEVIGKARILDVTPDQESEGALVD
ncbi:MAG: c-type cytochrome [Geminicoccaceae bacterium]